MSDFSLTPSFGEAARSVVQDVSCPTRGSAVLQSGDKVEELAPVDVIAGCDGVNSAPWPGHARTAS